MNRIYLLVTIILFSLSVLVSGQVQYSGRVYDAVSKQALPFATIKFGDSGEGMVADLDGNFLVPPSTSGKIAYIEISCLGYQTLRLSMPLVKKEFFLQPEIRSLGDVVIKPPYEKIRRILKLAIANKKYNNPDKYDWYQCHVYYKMLADFTVPDSIMKDTSKDTRELKTFLDQQHLLMSETYSIRTWRSPQQLQEDVVCVEPELADIDADVELLDDAAFIQHNPGKLSDIEPLKPFIIGDNNPA